MLKISDFSKLSRISIRMLRFYDEHNLLKPAKIEDNGYRYYDVKQLYLATQIHYLSYLGLKTKEIKQILFQLQSGVSIVSILQTHLDKLAKTQQTIQEKMKSLQKTLDKMNEEEMMMNYHVEVKTMPARFMMCKRGIIPSYDKEGLLWKDLNDELQNTNQVVEYLPNGVAMAVFHDEGYQEKEVDVEIRVEVKEKQYQNSESITFCHIEAVKVASITFTGGYEHITEVCIEIAKWLSKNHCEIVGPNFSIYHVGYERTQNPAEFVTEICYPIK